MKKVLRRIAMALAIAATAGGVAAAPAHAAKAEVTSAGSSQTARPAGDTGWGW